MSAYRFLPWVRRGLAAAIGDEHSGNNQQRTRVDLPIRFSVNGERTIAAGLSLYGPGDVKGLDVGHIVRTDPRPNTTGFEPNYFPLVEFDSPDLPWLFTPAPAAADGKLQPWLCLVVVEEQAGVTIGRRSGAPLPVLSIAPPARPSIELPDLTESWAWAHTQVVTPDIDTPLDDLLDRDSVQSVSRLVCPRRLRPDRRYLACVVPTFAVGVDAGLGLPVDPEATLEPAWKLDALDGSLDLPVYHHWRFGTGTGGDFESLARRLAGRAIPAGVGVVELDAHSPGFGLPSAGSVAFAGALVPPGGPAPLPAPTEFGSHVRGLLESTLEGATTADPVVGPPVYGSRHHVVEALPNSGWMADLNLLPQTRAGAGLGVEVIRRNQDELMAAAWDQLAEPAERSRRQQIGRAFLARLYQKRFASRSADQLTMVTAPSHARVLATGGTETVHSELVRLMPSAVFTANFRKTARPQSHVVATATSASSQRVASSILLTVDSRFVSLGFRPTPRPADESIAISALEQRVDQLDAAIRPQDDRGARLVAATTELRTYFESALDRAPPRPPRRRFDFSTTGHVAIHGLGVTRPKVFFRGTVSPSTQLPIGPSSDGSADGAPEPIGPTFRTPMYEALRAMSPDFILPGAAGIPEDTVTLLSTNRPFIESFMVGLNHEMSRELLWREFPGSLRATTFSNFWQAASAAGAAQDQLTGIHSWDLTSGLGTHFTAGNSEPGLVLLIRGELLSRYPNTLIYAVAAESSTKLGTERRMPIITGRLDPDMVFVGFDLSLDDVQGRGGAGWFFVLEQPLSEIRFGLDESADFSRDPTPVDLNLAWSDVVADEAALAALSHAPAAGRLDGRMIAGARWGKNGGHQAAATRQLPFRFAVHAADMLDGVT